MNGRDLLLQAVDELTRRAYRDRRDVVDRLVRIQLGALTADGRQGVHHFGFHAQQAQFENLKQAAGAGTDDDRVCDDGQFGSIKRQGHSPE